MNWFIKNISLKSIFDDKAWLLWCCYFLYHYSSANIFYLKLSKTKAIIPNIHLYKIVCTILFLFQFKRDEAQEHLTGLKRIAEVMGVKIWYGS